MKTEFEAPTSAVLDSVRGTRDALSVRRVFGEPYHVNGMTVIPVARIAGGGGGGGGGGEGPEGAGNGSGFGTGFGLRAEPVGVYEVRDTSVVWKPIIDVTRLAKGGQVLIGIMAVCTTLMVIRRRR